MLSTRFWTLIYEVGSPVNAGWALILHESPRAQSEKKILNVSDILNKKER